MMLLRSSRTSPRAIRAIQVVLATAGNRSARKSSSGRRQSAGMTTKLGATPSRSGKPSALHSGPAIDRSAMQRPLAEPQMIFHEKRKEVATVAAAGGAGRQRPGAGTDFGQHARPSARQYRRENSVRTGGRLRLVTNMADAGGLEPGQQLAVFRIREIGCFHGQRCACFPYDGGQGIHSGSRFTDTKVSKLRVA